jgi:hypothetical protein
MHPDSEPYCHEKLPIISGLLLFLLTIISMTEVLLVWLGEMAEVHICSSL